MSSRIFGLAVFVAVIIAVCTAGASFLSAQEFRATIIGQVSDPSGGPIPGATVTAVQHGTNQTYTAKSDADGVYSVDYISSGQFTVTIEAQGFSQKVYPNVTLDAGQKLNLNVTLVVGSVRQQVTVTASPGLLNTATASSGGVVDQTKVTNFVTTGKDVWEDVTLTQGVMLQGESADFVGAPIAPNQSFYSVNGSPSDMNSYFVNGAPVGPAGNEDFDAEEDSVQELQTSVSGGAQYGPAAGGVFDEIVKQGTNNFHGSVYEYNQTGTFVAAPFLDDTEGIKKSPNTRNIFGGTLGGPVRKDKTFFFFGYEGGYHSNPLPASESVPTAAMREGDFSGTGYTLYDPSTVTCTKMTSSGCSTYGRTAFPNDTIPQSDISPIASAIMNLYPQPNVAGVLSNYGTSGVSLNHYNQYIGRVDHSISESTRLNGVFSWQRTYTASGGNALPGLATTSPVEWQGNQLAVLNLTHTFSPTMVGNVEGSFSRYSNITATGVAVAQNLSIPGLSMPFIPTTTHQNIAPEIAVTGFTSAIGNTDNGSLNNIWYLAPTLFQVKGRHTLQYGFNFMDIQSGATGIPGEPNGTFTFSGEWTQQNPLTATTGTGNSFADLLLGYPASGSVDWSINDFTTYHYYAGYIEDDFKALKNVTLNMGLRWEADTSPSERHNGINGSFCFTCTNPYTSQINYSEYPTLENPLTGGLTFAGVTAPRAPDNVDLNNWQPRFGIAWAITPNTVLRAGFGIYYSPAMPSTTAMLSTTNIGFSESTSYIASLNGNVNPTNYFLSGKPFPNGVLAPAGASGGLETDAGDAITYDSPSGAVPWSPHWSVGFQRALPKQILLDVQYAGSHTHALDVSQPWGVISLAQQEACFQNNAICNDSASNPFYGVLPAAATLGSSKTLNAWELMRQQPLFDGVTQSNDPIGYSNYDALQVRAERKVKSLDFVLNYEYSMNNYADNYLDYNNVTPSNAFVNSNLWYGPWEYNERHYFVPNVNWQLPVGQGGLLFRNAHGLLGGLLNHWEAVSTFIISTGNPISVPSANLVGGPGCTSYYPVGSQTHAHWFNNNESCYTPLADWQARTTPSYVDYLNIPGHFDWDYALQKSFALPREGMFFRLRVECVNCTNTPYFAAPNTTLSDLPTLEPKVGWQGFGTLPDSAGQVRVFVLSGKITF